MAMLELQRRRLARSSLIAFSSYTFRGYVAADWHRRLAAALDRVVRGECRRLLVVAPPRHGKLCADSTPVLTTSGWVPHGHLKPGDYVFGTDGEPTKVLAVSKPSTTEYVVEFTDGTRIFCHGRHEWTLIYKRRRYITIETQDLAAVDLWTGPIGKRGSRAKYQLPHLNATNTPARNDLPIHPYALGVWLGDGSENKAQITMCAKDAAIVMDAFAEIGHTPTCKWVHPATGVWTFSVGGPRPNVMSCFSRGLKDLGLRNKKHIPDAYMTASLEQRLQLLAGMVDTDGHADKKTGRIRIATCDAVLARDIRRLCATLGFSSGEYVAQPCISTSGVIGRKPVYYIGFTPHLTLPVRLERKKSHLARKRELRAIRSIRKLDAHEVEAGRCIQVNRPDGLYLVGDCLIPTHNSQLVSRNLPPYYLGHYPDKEVIATAYGQDLINDFGRDVRTIVQSPEYGALFPETRISSDVGAIDRWRVGGRRGGYVASGVGGAITGRGADLLIIDDPVKSRVQAESETERENIWNWYRSVAYTRLMPGAAIVLTLTRWHEDDLAGKILASARAHAWEVLHFPAIDSDGRALWPERYPVRSGNGLEGLEDIRETLGPYEWSALYEGHPRPLEGGYYQERDFLIELPGQAELPAAERVRGPVESIRNITCVAAFIDAAEKSGDAHDGLGVVYCGYSEHFNANAPEDDPTREGKRSLTVLDWDYTQIDAAYLADWIPGVFVRLEELARETRALRGSVGALVEDKAGGIVLCQQAANRGWPVRAIDSKLTSLGKVERALNASPYIKGGQVKMLRAAKEKQVTFKGRTRNHLMSQVLDFKPTTRDQGEDDLLDCLSYAAALTLGSDRGF